MGARYTDRLSMYAVQQKPPHQFNFGVPKCAFELFMLADVCHFDLHQK